MSNAAEVIETKRQVVPLRSGAKPLGIVPETFEECYRLAKMFAAAGPDSYRNKPDECCVAIMQGLELGLSPIAALQSIAVINGRPCLWGDGALGVVRGSGLVESFDETDDGETATCTIKRRGEPTPVVRKFSMADAKRAGLSNKKGPWQDYPQRMRQMRARSWALRDGFADVLKGISVAEEVQDIPAQPMRDITPAQSISSAPSTGGCISEQQVEQIQSLIVDAGADIRRFMAYLTKTFKCSVEKLSDIPADKFQATVDALEAKRKAQK
jgi:hypothetical protein